MTTGEQIAKAFSDDKCHLSDAEQRRLAGMIDAKDATCLELLDHIDGQAARIEALRDEIWSLQQTVRERYAEICHLKQEIREANG